MAESMGGDVLGQVLQAVQGLSEQVKGLSNRMDKLEGRMDKLEGRMETQHEWLQRLGLEFMGTRDEVKQLRLEVQQSREEFQQAHKSLGADVQAARTELQLGIRQMHDRIDRNNDAVLLMVSGLQRNTTERFEPMEHRLKALEVR
ncbi:hypothetical protein [Archangium violaceum]|uniref:Uncharacterized protein n=1 Tax=Archangium violaceum Cb vi76 TaxID=1406225 RepID=A0A084SG82_9BACT|nr:hypothetical protein [Archangium violaceum]KFA87467.1 hypothetical protein Q664_48250 [Archangium violaceum Cb vi76]